MKWQNQVVFPLLIINASGTFTGLFVYNPSIGAGNLEASIAAAGGTDPYGNAYLPGLAVYQQGAGPLVATQVQGAGVQYFTAATQAGPWAQQAIMDFIAGTSSLNVAVTNLLKIANAVSLTASSAVTGQLLAITNSAAAPGAPPVQLIAAAAADRMLGVQVTGDAANFRLQIDSNGRHDWGPGSGAVDTDLFRASAAVLATDSSWRPKTMAALATQTQSNFAAERVIGTYTIPAGDAANGSSYTFWGAGVASDTLTPTLQLRIRVGGLTGATIGNTGVMTCRTAAGMAFSWNGRLAFTTAGAASVIDADTQINEEIIATTGGGHPLASSGAAGPDTTAAVTVVITAAWSVANAANTISTTSGSMERIQH